MINDMQKISIGEVDLCVQITGKGTPLFLVSGLGGRASFWAKQVAPFAEQYRVITHDHRGTGGSTKSLISYSVAQMADDVLRLMDALSLPKVAMVGHSTGGAITQYLALEHPDRLSCIVLSATWAGPSPYFHALFRLRSRILDELGPEAYFWDGILRAYPPKVLCDSAIPLAENHEDRVAAFPGKEIETSRIEAVLAHDLRDYVSMISIPTLVIGAADDQITPESFSDELANLIPNSQRVILPFGGHFVPQVSVNAYNEAVMSFIQDQQRRGYHA